MPSAAILDVDGTLVDTNYQHALAWYRAFRQNGVLLPVWRIHRQIGMGGDQLVGALCGEETERDKGERIRSAEKELYLEMIDEVEPLHGARELIEDLKRRGHAVVLASSARKDEVDHYLDLLGAARPRRRLDDLGGRRGDQARARPDSRPRSRRRARARP